MDSCALHEGREKKNQVDMDTPEGWSRVMSQLLVAYPCSQYSLPGWLCPSPGDQPVCAGAVLCWGHPSVSRESPSGMLPLLPPLHYPHQATQHTQGNLRLQGRSWTMAQNPPWLLPSWCCGGQNQVVRQNHFHFTPRFEFKPGICFKFGLGS